MTIRLPAVEGRLGVPLDSVDASAVLGLLGLPETEDFDFKRELYKDTADLCVDVAAMANSQGGVILIGFDEQGTGQAQAATHVALSDQEELRMRQAVASVVAPLPLWAIRPVEDPAAGAGQGFYLLIVARGDQTPHAVRKGSNLKYPARNGTSTRYLGEHEVADAYRNRFQAARARLGRLDEVSAAVRLRYQGKYVPWLTLAVVPTMSARLRLSSAAVTATDQWLRLAMAEMPFGSNFNVMQPSVIPGLRCFEVTDPAVGLGLPDMPPHAYRAAAHLAIDGATAVGVNLVINENPSRNAVSEEFLFVQIMSALHVATGYAAKVANLTGDALVRMRIPVPNPPEPNMMDRSLVLVAGDSGPKLSQVPGSRPFNSLTVNDFASEHTIDLDTAASSLAGVAAAAVPLITDVINACGVAEPKVVTTSGALRGTRWHSGYRQGISQWATQHGVPVI